VLELRFGLDGDAQPLEAIGKELGISRERVRQVESDAQAHLAAELGGADFAQAA
jgi:DNA-directed RNA polymerase sigma subunit (sigma70/sigma32)